MAALSVRPTRPHLPALTGLRFLAALHVVVYHLWRHEAWDAPLVVERAVRAGPASVTLFFVLSGFVLAYAHAGGAGDNARLSTSLGRFYRARFARIYPVHVLGLLIALPVVLALWRRAGGGGEALALELQRGLATAFLVQAWLPGFALAWNPPAWSLSVEVFCYLLFPLVAPRLLAASKERALVVAAVAWGLSLVVSLGLALAADAAASEETQRALVHAFKFHPLVRLPDFVIGIVAARLFLEEQGLDDKGPPRIPRLLWALAGGTLVVAALGLVPYALWHNGWLAPLFALVILELAARPGRIARVLSSRIAVALGEASYALYLLHVPLLYWIAGLGERRTGAKVLENPVVALASLLFCVVVSLAVYRVYEAPLRRWLRPRSVER